MPAKLNYPTLDRSPVEDKNPLDLPYATDLAADDVIVVIKDPTGTPSAKAATLGAIVAGGSNNSSGNGQPPPAPPDPTILGFYVDEDTDSLVYWNVENQEWRVLLGNLVLP